VDFTNKQIEKFFSVTEALKSKNYDVGKLHILASYGIYNYPALECDYARAGIALYGVMSHKEETKIKPQLKPVLSLRARIAEVQFIGIGESVSYARTFIAKEPMKIATITVGYADGIPRQMSGNGGMCILHGHKAPIIGRICMDLIVIDVSKIDSAIPGDIVTFIGRDGGEEIRCEDFAMMCGTISNDILCRLGERLQRIYKE
jgi:serine/alanine racemase